MDTPVQSSTDSLALALRERTASLHHAAEQRPIQQAMLRGDVAVESYAAFLATRLAIHARLEPALLDLAKADPRITPIIDPGALQEQNLLADIQDLDHPLDHEPSKEPVAHLLRYVDDLAERRPIALLGVHYVLEGSKNGGRFLQPRVGHALGPSRSSATRYLNPHGSQQGAVWKRYRQALDAAPLDSDQREAIVEAAQETFRAIADIDGQLLD